MSSGAKSKGKPPGNPVGKPPWIFRTYAGHSTAKASNELYRTNLTKGQTGLSVAFDLPTQTGYDADHALAKGEVGKVGVPVSHLGDMRALFDGIPLGEMNTSMTINATAAWLLALYIALAEEQGVAPAALKGTTQNDIIKEYLSRGTHIFPPEPSLRLITDMVSYTYTECPKWNPVNVCSYHLQEAGATPVQELAFSLANAAAILDHVKASGQVPEKDFGTVVGRISFFVNAGLRFVEELCKMRAFVDLWDEIAEQRYRVTDPKHRRFRYGVQVNSLGLTEQQPENNVYRILIEMLAVTLSKDARARAIQLPAWNEALGLPRPWDQQWSLRAQQILAYETDLLDYDDIFTGSKVVDEKVETLKKEARAEFNRIIEMGGAVAGVETGYLKSQLVEANAVRLNAIESGQRIVVGVNQFTESEDSLLAPGQGSFLAVSEAVEQEQIERLQKWRAGRDGKTVETALADIEQAAKDGRNIMLTSIAAAKAGVTTGEWAETLRRVFGDYRAPTGVAQVTTAHDGGDIEAVRKRVEALAEQLGRRPKLLVGKPGLDGHSNGAEQIAVRARDCGFDVVYEGIRLTPRDIASAALDEGVDVIGLSILSGSHVPLVEDVLTEMKALQVDVPLVIGGIIPQDDEDKLKSQGVAAIYTPKDYDLTRIMDEIVGLIEEKSPK